MGVIDGGHPMSRKEWLQRVATLLVAASLNPLAVLRVPVETEAVLPLDPRPCLREGDTLLMTWTVNF